VLLGIIERDGLFEVLSGRCQLTLKVLGLSEDVVGLK
jgi:hypothetical protein